MLEDAPSFGRVPAAPKQDLRLVLCTRGRGRLRLAQTPHDWCASPDELCAIVSARGTEGRWLLAGGEPTLSPELPRVIELLVGLGVRAPGLVTDGWLLAERRVARHLHDRGLATVVVQLHSAHPAAHDFVVGLPGSARRCVAAIQASRAEGLAVEGEILATKPTVSHLAETVAVLARLGAKRIIVRRLAAFHVASADALSLMPRLLPSCRHLTAAAHIARELGIDLAFAGFPPCVLLGCAPPVLRVPAEELLLPHGTMVGLSSPAVTSLGGPACSGCQASLECAGAMTDYTDVFGHNEFDALWRLARRRVWASG